MDDRDEYRKTRNYLGDANIAKIVAAIPGAAVNGGWVISGDNAAAVFQLPESGMVVVHDVFEGAPRSIFPKRTYATERFRIDIAEAVGGQLMPVKGRIMTEEEFAAANPPPDLLTMLYGTTAHDKLIMKQKLQDHGLTVEFHGGDLLVHDGKVGVWLVNVFGRLGTTGLWSSLDPQPRTDRGFEHRREKAPAIQRRVNDILRTQSVGDLLEEILDELVKVEQKMKFAAE